MKTWTWDRLRIFDAVAHAGSVTAAARALNMSGPAVSQHLHRLETEVGVALVERAGRGIRLTHHGIVLAEHARRLVEIVRQAERDVAQTEQGLRGTLRIGAIASAIRGLLCAPLRQFTRQHPQVRVHLEDGEAAEHLRRLHESALDVVITESWHNQPASMPRGVRATRLFSERAHVVVPAGHPLAERASIKPADLADAPWACCPPGSDAHTALLQLTRRAGIELDIAYCVADHTTQLDLVAAGLAIACVPELSLRDTPAGVHITDTDPSLSRSLDMVTRTGPLDLHVSAFTEFLAASLPVSSSV